MKNLTLITVFMTGLFFIGAASTPAQTVAGKWKLEAMLVESDMAYGIDAPVTLTLFKTGEMSGNGGCHEFTGRYSFKQPKKPFKKAKKIEVIELDILDDGADKDCRMASGTEQAFFNSLSSAATVEFEDGLLVIQNKPTFVNDGNRRIVIQNTMAFVRDTTEVLCDFRYPESPCSWGELNENGTNEFYGVEVSKEESDRVMDNLFGKDRDRELQISTKFSGSFTKPNAKETLYYVRGCKKGEGPIAIAKCPDDSEPNAGWIAIYDGKKMTQKIDILIGDVIPFVTDVDGDGKNEILSLGETSGMGVTTVTGELGQIFGSEYQTVFPTGEDTFFGYTETAGKCFVLATAVSYDPKGKFPAFTEEYFKREGCESSTWKKITKKQFDAYLETESNKSEEPESSIKSKVLCDFRNLEAPCSWGEPEKNAEFYPLEISQEETVLVLDYLFGKDRKKDLEISTKVSGSFTKPNAKETLYHVRCRDKGESPTEITCTEPNEGWIAIHDGKKLTHMIKASLGSIRLVTDVDGDGRHEILSLSERLAMGVTTMSGELGQISGSVYQALIPTGDDTFFGSYERTDRDKCIAVATVVSYKPKGESPAFTEDYFEREGCESSAWQKITRKKFDSYLEQY